MSGACPLTVLRSAPWNSWAVSGAGSSGPWEGRSQRARALCGVKRMNTSGALPGKDKSLFSFPLGLVGARLSLTQAGRFELIS